MFTGVSAITFYEKELNFFCKLIENSRIRTTVISDFRKTDDIDMGIRRTLGLRKDYEEFFFRHPKDQTIIKLKDSFGCRYFFLPLPDKGQAETLIVGPYITDLISKEDIEKEALSYSLSAGVIKNIQKYFSIVPYISDDTFINLSVNCLCETLFKTDEFVVENIQAEDINDISTLIVGKHTDEADSPLVSIQMIEKAYEQENKLLDAISQGLVHKAETFFTTGKPSDMLESRVTDKLRNAKNFLIVLNTLSRKAVEQGGVHPIYIDNTSSDFAMKIEACQTTEECDELFFSLVRKYSRLVQKHSQKSYSLLVQKVITCIDSDIAADLSLKTQAKLLNVNPSYLSSLFKKETGVTLTDYVNKKRVERAKQLLKAGHTQIQNVSQCCGIYDVNYFTKIFKKYEGVTPKEYRESKKA